MQVWLVSLPSAGLCYTVGITYTMKPIVLFGTPPPFAEVWMLYLGLLYLGQLPRSLAVHLLLLASCCC